MPGVLGAPGNAKVAFTACDAEVDAESEETHDLDYELQVGAFTPLLNDPTTCLHYFDECSSSASKRNISATEPKSTNEPSAEDNTWIEENPVSDAEPATAALQTLQEDANAVSTLHEIILRPSARHISQLYAYRGLLRAIPKFHEANAQQQTQDKKKNDSSNPSSIKVEYHLLVEKIMEPEIRKIYKMFEYTERMMSTLLSVISRLGGIVGDKEDGADAAHGGKPGSAEDAYAAQFVSETLLLALARSFDVVLMIDTLKNTKASLSNDFALVYRRARSITHNTAPAPAFALDNESMKFQMFLADRNVLLTKLRLVGSKYSGFQNVVKSVSQFCVAMLERNCFASPSDRFSIVRALCVATLLHEPVIASPKYKMASLDKHISMLKQYPVIPLYGDQAFELSFYFKDVSLTQQALISTGAQINSNLGTLNISGNGLSQNSTANNSAAMILGGASSIQRKKTAEYAAANDYASRWYSFYNQFSYDTVGPTLFMLSQFYKPSAASSTNQMCSSDLNTSSNQKLEAHDTEPATIFTKTVLERLANRFIVYYSLVKQHQNIQVCPPDQFMNAMGTDEYSKYCTIAFDHLVAGLQLISDACGVVLQANSIKCARRINANSCPQGASIYELAVRYNYTEADKAGLLDILHNIKNCANMIKKMEIRWRPFLRSYLHLTFTSMKEVVADALSQQPAQGKNAKRDMLAIKYLSTLSSVLKIEELEPNVIFMFSSVIEQMMSANERLRGPGTLFSRGSALFKPALAAKLTEFQRNTVLWAPYILDYERAVQKASDLGDLWFKEFHLEVSRQVQFSLESSLPWLLLHTAISTGAPRPYAKKSQGSANSRIRNSMTYAATHVHQGTPTQNESAPKATIKPSAKQHGKTHKETYRKPVDLLSSLFLPFALYEDASRRALHEMKLTYIFNEIEAEANLAFDLLLYHYSKLVYRSFKFCAADACLPEMNNIPDATNALNSATDESNDNISSDKKDYSSNNSIQQFYKNIHDRFHCGCQVHADVLAENTVVSVLDRKVPFALLVHKLINIHLLSSVKAIITQFEQSDLHNIIELSQQLEIARVTHFDISEFLPHLDEFTNILYAADCNENSISRITLHAANELVTKICPAFVYNYTLDHMSRPVQGVVAAVSSYTDTLSSGRRHQPVVSRRSLQGSGFLEAPSPHTLRQRRRSSFVYATPNLAQKFENMMVPLAEYFGRRHFSCLAELLGGPGIASLVGALEQEVSEVIDQEIMAPARQIWNASNGTAFAVAASNDPFVCDQALYMNAFDMFLMQPGICGDLGNLGFGLRHLGNILYVVEALEQALYLTEQKNASLGVKIGLAGGNQRWAMSLWPRIVNAIKNSMKRYTQEKFAGKGLLRAYSAFLLAVCSRPTSLATVGTGEPIDFRLVVGDSFAISGAALLCAIEQYATFVSCDFVQMVNTAAKQSARLTTLARQGSVIGLSSSMSSLSASASGKQSGQSANSTSATTNPAASSASVPATPKVFEARAKLYCSIMRATVCRFNNI